MDEEGGGYLAPFTGQCLFNVSIDRLKQIYADGNPDAIAALTNLKNALCQAERSSPSFLYDYSKVLLSDSKLRIDLQESYLRMQANNSNEDLELPQFAHIPEFQDLSERAIILRKVLARIPDEMKDRRPFLDTIKEIASTIKKLLDTTNAIIQLVPVNSQQVIEKRKREFVKYSKQFSNTLKDYFKQQNSTQVFIAANMLIYQTMQIVRALRERVRMDVK